MIEKLAAGLIIFRRISNSIEYLLLQTSYGQNHWTPPKGHLDEGEDDLTAAVRETKEEAGLIEEKDYTLMSRAYTIESKYLINNVKPKRVIYWLAEVKEPNVEIKLSDEHITYKWLKLADACNIVEYDEMKRVLSLADNHIINYMKN